MNNSLKGIFIGLGFSLALAVLLMYRTGSAAPANTGTGGETEKISVSGSADVMVVPDQVVFTLGIDTRDRDISKAKSENDKRVRSILAVADKFTIDKKDIQMDYLDVRPADITQKSPYIYYYGDIPSQNAGYAVRKKIVITLKDLSRFEGFLTEVLKNGAEYVQGIEFKTSELRKYKDSARELAVKAAREKADAMSAALGQKAGKAVSIVEQQEYYWSWYDSWYGGYYGNQASMLSNVQNIAPAAEGKDTGDIAPGQLKIRAGVRIDFELE